MNKKGLSDVVTTLLIIVIALAAVVIVGSIVLRMVKNTGTDIEKAGVCNTNKVEIVNCVYTVGEDGNSVANVAYRRVSDEKVKEGVEGTVTPSLIVSAKSGSALTVSGGAAGSLPSAGSASFARYTGTGEVKQVDGSAKFTLINGQTQVCNSAPITCERSDGSFVDAGNQNPVPCTDYVYSAWSACVNNQRTRSISGYTPAGCQGTPSSQPVLTESCTSVPCVYTPSSWTPDPCSPGQTQTQLYSSSPAGCQGTPPVSTRTCPTLGVITVNINSPTPNQAFTNPPSQSVGFSGTVTGDGDTVTTLEVKLDGITLTGSYDLGSFSGTLNSLSAGTHTLIITATDSNGHTGTKTVTFTVSYTQQTNAFTGLISYFKMDEISGTTITDSIGGSGTCLNDDNLGNDKWVSGQKVGNSRKIDRTGHCNTNKKIPGNGDFSINLWVKSTYASFAGAIFGNRGEPSNFFQVGVGESDRKLYIQINNELSSGTGMVTDQNWHMVTLTYSINDGDIWKLYVDDGSPVEFTNIRSAMAGDVYIASNYNQPSEQATFDEFGIWNRALTREEIGWLYNGGSGRTYSSNPSL